MLNKKRTGFDAAISYIKTDARVALSSVTVLVNLCDSLYFVSLTMAPCEPKYVGDNIIQSLYCSYRAFSFDHIFLKPINAHLLFIIQYNFYSKISPRIGI
jgi:hypothetical protein